MSTEAAAPAPVATESANADPMERVVAAAQAREDAKESAPKGGATAAKDSQESTAASADAKKPEKKKVAAADLGAIARREREVTQKSQRADAIEAKYKPLNEALEKRDYEGVLNLLATSYGAKLGDFVELLSKQKSEETTEAMAERIARETIEKAKAKDLEVAEAEQAKDIDTRIGKMRTRLEEMADGGGERWELTAIAGTASAAWDVIEGFHASTGKSLPLEEALDLVEKKLRDKRDARRSKQSGANPSAGEQTRNEAVANGNSGRAGEPSFTNRSTSGVPGVIGAKDVDIADLPEHEAIDLAIRRAKARGASAR